MFCGKSGDSAVWIVSEDWRSLVLADRLLTDVEDGAIAGRAADDGGENAEIAGRWPVDLADLRVVLAGEDAAAGLDLGDPGDIGGELVRAGAARRDDPAVESGGLDQVARLRAACRSPRRWPRAFRRGRRSSGYGPRSPSARRIAGPGVAETSRASSTAASAVGHAGAFHSEVDVDQHADRRRRPPSAAWPSGATWSGWSTVTLTSA